MSSDDTVLWGRGRNQSVRYHGMIARVTPTRVNGENQLFITVNGRFGKQIVERTYNFPFPLMKMDTVEETTQVQTKMLHGYLDAIKEILEAEHGQLD